MHPGACVSQVTISSPVASPPSFLSIGLDSVVSFYHHLHLARVFYRSLEFNYVAPLPSRYILNSQLHLLKLFQALTSMATDDNGAAFLDGAPRPKLQ